MEEPPFTLVVAGLGRCGTSLAMQLLDRAGYPCFGEYPSYETDETNPLCGIPADLLQRNEGRAVKIIDPHHAAEMCGISFNGCRVIYLTRDLTEQARSQIKMAAAFSGFSGPPTRRDIFCMRGALKRENRKVKALFKKNRVLHWTFEDLLENPQGFLRETASFTGKKLNDSVAWGVVRPRPSACYQGFLELELMEVGDGR